MTIPVGATTIALALTAWRKSGCSHFNNDSGGGDNSIAGGQHLKSDPNKLYLMLHFSRCSEAV